MKLLVALLLSGLILSLLVASGFAAPCPKCGKDVPADARFCGECGAKVDKPWEHPGTKAGEEITGPDGGKMVWVPAGEFLMGCNHSDKDSGLSDFPVHRVRLTRGFWLSKCVVTFGQWKRYCRTAKVAGPPLIYAPGDDYPVPGIGCAGAEAYCRFYGLALPTEAQWEYAARGPESRKYPWGNQWDPKKCCHEGNPGQKGQGFPVGSFPEGASWCGALDMSGGLFQWCADWFSADYYDESPGTDPPGPVIGHLKVIRGGSSINDAECCRGAARGGTDPGDGGGYQGFRCSYAP